MNSKAFKLRKPCIMALNTFIVAVLIVHKVTCFMQNHQLTRYKIEISLFPFYTFVMFVIWSWIIHLSSVWKWGNQAVLKWSTNKWKMCQFKSFIDKPFSQKSISYLQIINTDYGNRRKINNINVVYITDIINFKYIWK